jgi:tellurite resistance protein TehA-like permease
MKILGLISAVIGCLAFGYILAYLSYYWKNLSIGGKIVSIIIEIITLLLLFLGIYVYKL